MRDISTELRAHLDTGTTTLAYCWRVLRKDAELYGFTDHDRDLVLNGETYVGSTGITTTTTAMRLGLSVDNLEIKGVIDGDIIRQIDIDAGLFDEAEVDLYIVNWEDTTQFTHIAKGTFGHVSSEENGFTVEFRAQSHKLQQDKGRTYKLTCDAELGDDRCTVDLDTPEFTVPVTVSGVTNGFELLVDGIEDFDDGWFSRGKLTDENGAVLPVKLSRDNTITLWSAPVVPIAELSSVTLEVGCLQDCETCKVKFDNILNFQGFPHIPGPDALSNYAVRGVGKHDGGSIFDAS